MEPTSDEAPGWAAIDEALAKLYGDQKPSHFAPEVPPSLGGDYPFEGVSIYRSDAGGPHWHAVTYGLTELHKKESDNKKDSGWGFELTVRIPRVEGENAITVVNQILEPIGQYVWRTGNWFEHGHRIPMSFQSKMPGATLGALAFCLDPELGSIDTVHGQVRFLQAVGITEDELERIRDASKGNGSTECLLGVLKDQSPMLIMEFERESVLANAPSRNQLESCLKKLDQDSPEATP